MQQISLIVAMNKDNVIGVDNKLPWYIPEDLKYFKQNTLGKPVIMGRKTFESIGKALPERKNIVITRNADFHAQDITTVSSLNEAIGLTSAEPEVCIIGGGEIFKQALPLANKLYITVVKYRIKNPTTFFPNVDYDEWQLIKSTKLMTAAGIICCFSEYIKKG